MCMEAPNLHMIHWRSQRGSRGAIGPAPHQILKTFFFIIFVMEQKKSTSNDAKRCTRLHLRVPIYKNFSKGRRGHPSPGQQSGPAVGPLQRKILATPVTWYVKFHVSRHFDHNLISCLLILTPNLVTEYHLWNACLEKRMSQITKQNVRIWWSRCSIPIWNVKKRNIPPLI